MNLNVPGVRLHPHRDGEVIRLEPLEACGWDCLPVVSAMAAGLVTAGLVAVAASGFGRPVVTVLVPCALLLLVVAGARRAEQGIAMWVRAVHPPVLVDVDRFGFHVDGVWVEWAEVRSLGRVDEGLGLMMQHGPVTVQLPRQQWRQVEALVERLRWWKSRATKSAPSDDAADAVEARVVAL